MRKGSGIGRKPDCHPDRKYESRGMCKSCYTKWYEENNAEKVAERKKRYYEKSREKHRQYQREWKISNPEKLLALRGRYRSKNQQSLLERHRDYNHKNRDSINSKNREYVKNNPEKRTETKLKNRYYLSVSGYKDIYDKQNGLCAICGGVNSKGKKLCVDHDHETGTIRGLLCSNCNSGIGMLKDSVSLLEKAIKYLREHGK